MKFYHATTTENASLILREGFRGGRVWDHEDVVCFADRPLPDFGDLTGSSWIVIEADEDLLARLDVYTDYERAGDEMRYNARCFCLPVAAVNALEMYEEQGLVPRSLYR